MELKICHLYPDVMNLSCDRGNLICMEKRLQWRGIDVTVTAVNMGDVVSAQLHMEKDGQPYVSKVDTYSVAQYAYSQMNQATSPMALKILCAIKQITHIEHRMIKHRKNYPLHHI